VENKAHRVQRTFSRETPDQRKQGLIQATLRVISKNGLSAATVRAIAQEANVTQGLIRHHFSNKEELICAAYDYHMQQMNQPSFKAADLETASARERLAKFVIISLSPPVVDQQAIALWAGFFQLAQHDARMHTTHKRTYLQFRDKIESLIEEAVEECGGRLKIAQLRRLAIACNAIIDGLWLEGVALQDHFSISELADIGLVSIGKILDINLSDFTENS
jgi:TetR/AcrR family transcriptional repressor of bet genes